MRGSTARSGGPTHKAFASLDAGAQERLAGDIRQVIEQFKDPRSARGLAVPGEYLEVIVER
jgi:hypothetical protein